MSKVKRDRFLKVAENRTNKIIKLFDLLGNCANKNNYEYTIKDIESIIDALENEMEVLKKKFKFKAVDKKKFKLNR